MLASTSFCLKAIFRICFFFFKIFFAVDHFLKVFIEFVTILLLWVFLLLFFWPGGMWDLNSPSRDQTYAPGTGG